MLTRTLLTIVALLVIPAVAVGGTAIVPLPRERPDPHAVASATSGPSVPLPRERPTAMDTSSKPEASSLEPKNNSSVETSSAASSSEPSDTSSSSAEPSAPPRDYQVACPAAMQGQVTAKSMPPIHDGQCGIQSPLAVSAISANGRSIPLSSTITTDCGMASALPAWVQEVDSYLIAHDKTQIDTIDVSTNYECRNVDHAKTGNLSFHSFADALDIIGFKLKDGRTISIAPGFNGTPEQGRDILHFARDAACTHFMTVLGPDADSFHQDNMHLDLACHGKTCSARLCE